MPRSTRSVRARPLRFPLPRKRRPSNRCARVSLSAPFAASHERSAIATVGILKETLPPRNSHLALARRESLPPKDEATVHSLLSTARPGVSHCGNPAVNTRDIDQEVVMELLCSGIPGAPLNRESPEVSTFRQLLSLALILPLALLLSPLVLVGVIVLVASDADRSFQNEP